MTAYPCLYTTASVPSAPKAVRDPILKGANEGISFLFDLAFGYCYPGGPLEGRPAPDDPESGDTIYDVSGTGNGSWIAPASEVVYAGGGFDFSAVTQRQHELRAPATSVEEIISGDQEFAVGFYAKLPALADWYTNTGMIPLFCTTDNSGGIAMQEDLLTIGMVNGGILRGARTTTAVGTYETRSVTLPTEMTGKVSQILYWRDASSTGIRVRNSGGSLMTQSASGAKASIPLGTRTPRWGVCNSLWDFGSKPSLANARKWRLFRGWIENLEVSGRDPLEVADGDYARTIARAVFG